MFDGNLYIYKWKLRRESKKKKRRKRVMTERIEYKPDTYAHYHRFQLIIQVFVIYIDHLNIILDNCMLYADYTVLTPIYWTNRVELNEFVARIIH